MDKRMPLLVFTDLDATLIDHDTYSWAEATPALAALSQINAGVVMASSKTAAEIGPLRAQMQLVQWPAIVENGAGLLPAHSGDVGQTAQYAALRDTLDTAPADLRALFCGFGDMTADQVSAATGLPPKDAALAKTRAFSEPGEWNGTQTQKTLFLSYLAQHGVTAQQGGRFLTLSFGGNKADQMDTITTHYSPQHTVALGDAPNDIQMLQHSDYGIIIANPHRAPLPPLQGETSGHIIRMDTPGPLGWSRAILSLLDRLELN